MFYKGCSDKNYREKFLLNAEFSRLKSVMEERENGPEVQTSDFYNGMTLKVMIFSIAVSKNE